MGDSLGSGMKMLLQEFIDTIQKKLKGEISVNQSYKLSVVTRLSREFLLEDADPKGIKQTIYDILTDKPVAFVFGAGISQSKPYKLPGWGRLVNAINSDYFLMRLDRAGGRKLLSDSLQKLYANEDLYELAQYIQNNIREDENFTKNNPDEAVSNAVNAEMYYFVKEALYENKTVPVGGEKTEDTCLPMLLAKYMEANPRNESNKIKRIITYNYDDVFEDCLTKHKILYYPVFIDDQLPKLNFLDPNACVIYHVHGYVPFYTKNGADELAEQQKKYATEIDAYLENSEAKALVLSEDSYDEIARSQYKWRNTIQAETFLSYNCFVFGFSASDKNFKRLTKLLDRKNPANRDDDGGVRHYIFFTIDDYIKKIFSPDKDISADKIIEGLDKRDEIDKELLLDRCELLYHVLRSKRKYLLQFGVYPVWTLITDAPLRVKSIFNS